ncbi:Breast cancer 2, early onset [Branchiostoma belcheri]|nr:Breast cancer 2, early onset [Branchiostoma belcheri]
MDFFSQISPTSLQEICEAADAAAEKSVESRNDSSGDRYKLEHQIQSSTSNYKLLDKRVSNTKEPGLGREDICDTKSIGKDRTSTEGSSSAVKGGKNSDLQPDEVSLSESLSPTNPTQGTLDVMNVSSQVLKQQTHAQEGRLAAGNGTAKVEADKTTLDPPRQQKQTATPSLVFNLKVPAKKDSLQDTPKFSVTSSASTMNKGGSARRFFYPTSSQISRLSESSASSRPQSTREHSKKALNTEEPNNGSASDRTNFHKSDELSTRIEISDKALKQAKAMMSEVDDSLLAEMAEHTDGSGDATLKDSRLPLPLTSRLVNISTGTLGTAKAFSGEVDTVNQEMSNRQLQKEGGPISNTDLVAISSTKMPASNHDVQESCSDESSCNGLSVRIPKGGAKCYGPLQEFTGFQTASKKPIQVSSNALKRAKIIAQEVESSMVGQGQLEEDMDRNPSLNANGLETTSTSDGISSTKAVTGNLEDFVSTRTSKNQVNSHCAASLHATGFKTASKKPIRISADAMRKARSMAAEVEAGLASGSDKHQVLDQTMKAVVTGFTTASEKPIRVAVSSMDKDCPGFRTASDKNISVSAESLQKARLLLAEVDEGHADQLSSTEDGSARKRAKTTVTAKLAAKPAIENCSHQKPRGPVPFKPPSKVLGSGKCSELSGRLRSVRTTANNNSVHSMSTTAGAPFKPSQPMGEENSLNDSFHDDQLFCTQMVSAAEVAESTYAFLQAEKENGGSDDDFGFSGHLENPGKTPDPNTSIFSGTEQGSFHSKETRSQTSPSKDKHHEIVHAPETESGHTNTANEAVSKCTEVTSVVSQHTPTSSDQKAVALEDGTSNHKELPKTSGKATQGQSVVNKKLQSTQRKTVTVCDAVRETDTALLDESFDLAWGLVDEMLVKAMEASAQKSEENNTSGQDRQADTDHRHSLDSGLEESIITSQENNVSTTYSSSLEEPRYHSTCTSQAGQQKTEDVSFSVKKLTQREDMSYKSCPFTTAGGRKVSVKEGSLKHVKEMAKEELLPAKEISVPFNKLPRWPSPTEVSHVSSMEHLRETLPEDNQLKGDEGMKSSNNVGFSTAGGKKIHVSKKSLEKAGQLWDSTKLAEEERKASMSGEADCLSKFQGFQTASGHKVKVSDAALARAKQMWGDSGQPEQDMLAVSADKCLSKAEGFKTASGKRMRMSEKALQKAQQMWKEWEEPQGTPTSKVNASSSGFPGFQTASRHKVAVSEEALQKAQQLWKDTDRGETELEVDVKKKPCKTFPGLQTAGGRKIDVSKESLLRVKQMWKDEDENCDSQRDTSGKFATAGGKHVQVLEQARPKAEELYAETGKSSSGHKESSLAFYGFQTASGKKVYVSDQALSRAKEMWRDTMDDYANNVKDHDATTKDSLKCTGFQTAGGKKVHVSGEALQKAKLAWENDEVEETCAGSSVETQNSATFNEQIIKKKDMTRCPKNASSAGFKTASGRTVSVSETSLQRAKQMFQDVEEANISKSVLGKEPVGSSKLPEFQGFTTGRGQKIEVSKKSLQLAKNMWKESESGFDDLAESAKKSPEGSDKTTVPYRGFQTAGGQKIHVSKEALQKAKALFSEDVPLPGNNSERSPPTDQGQSNSGTEFKGFQTAKGHKIEVSKKSLQFAKNLWKESESGVDDLAVSEKKSPENSEKTTVTYRGFQTAGGQKIHVSKEALEKAKALFSDDAPLPGNNSERSPLTDQGQFNNGTEFRGFQTAKGRKIEVSKKSLQFAQNLWKESESGFDNLAVSEKKSPEDSEKTTVPYRGFQTAGGQKIHVSKESLQKAKALFSDDAPLPGNNSPEKSPLAVQGQSSNDTEFKGFQTAKGRKIEVSEDALQKARAILSDDVNEGQEGIQQGTKVESTKDTNASMFAGFQTARGQQIEVSEEALQKARERLSMETDTGFTESTAEHSPPLQRSDPRALSSGMDKYGHSTKTGLPQGKEDHLYRDRSARKRTLTSSETKAIWPPSKRQSPSPASYQAQHVGHRQAFRPPLATHPEGVVHDRHGFSVRTRLQPLHSKPRQDFRRPPSVPPPTRRPVVSTPQAHNSTENSFKTPFKSPAPTFSAPFKAKPGKEDGQTEYSSPVRATKDNIPDSQETCKDDNSECDKHETVTEHPEKVQALERTRKAQAVRIAQKKKQTIHPEYGSLLQRRLTQQCRVGLREAVCSQTPGSYTTQELYSYGVHQSTCTVTCETAESFRFICRDHVSPDTLDRGEGITLTDGGVLVPMEDGTAGKDEFVSALLDTPGVDPGLVTPEWIYNHYRWIVWKLAAMETAFPVQFGGRCLTPDHVLMQLKYRYDREVDLSQRSALKKILERDDTPSKTLILCVARITPHTISQDCAAEQDSKKGANTKQKETIIELTDGWYGVRAALDPPLVRLVESKCISLGQKLCVSGAELVGSQDACSPLEAPANLVLKLSANATRRARWDAKLGFHSNPQPFPVSLGSLCADGGMVGCVDVMVLRSYPMQYMEKYPSSSSVVRSRRAEEKAARKHEGDRNRRMEKLYSQIQDNSVGRRRKSLQLKTEDIENLHTGQEIYEALQGAMDPTEIEQCLSPAQRSRLYDHQRSLQAEQQGELQAEFRRALQQLDDEIPVQRNVVAMYRVRLADYHNKGARNTELTLTVWRPTDHVMDMLKEGRRLKIFHLSTSAARNQVQLASTRTTRYQDLPVKPDTLEEVYTPRKLATFDELCASDFSPTCGEVDVVGVVVYITGQSGTSSGVQTVFLADAEGNLCSVKFWGGVSAHNLEDVLKLRALVGGVNLQWRPADGLRVPCLMFGDQADFSQKPQHSHLREGLARLEESVKDVKSFTESMVQEVERVVYSRQAFSPGPANTSRAWASPNPGSRTAPHTPGSRIFTPARAHSTPNNSVSTPRLLHCTSPAAQVTPYGGNASYIANVQSSGKGKPSAQSRRSLLDRVPSPPPLTTLVSPIPHRVKRAFKRPGLVPLNNGRGSPSFVPPVKRTLADVEGNDLNKAASDVGSGDVTEISDAEMASICTQNTPDKREGSVANETVQSSPVQAQARIDGEQREDFISDTQLLTACTSDNGPRTDAQPNSQSPEHRVKMTPKQSKPFQRRSSGLQRRGRRGTNVQETRATAVQNTDAEMPGLQTTPVDCTTPEKETLAVPEDRGSSTPSAIDTVVIEDGIEKKTELEGSSQDSMDSQNVATRTRSSLRLAKKRKR